MPLDEDDMLQYAIEQSLAESSGGACSVHQNMESSSDKVDIWEALRGQGVGAEDEEDEQLQRYFKIFQIAGMHVIFCGNVIILTYICICVCEKLAKTRCHYGWFRGEYFLLLSTKYCSVKPLQFIQKTFWV